MTAASSLRPPVSPAGAPSGCPRPGQEPGRRGRHFAWLFAGMWLGYLLEPLRHAWSSGSTALAWRVVATAALLAFAAGFLWFFVWWRTRRIHRGDPARPEEVWRVLGVGVLLLVPAAPAGGRSVLNGLVYVGVAAAMTLPRRQAGTVVLLLVAAVLGLPRAVPGWAPEDGLVPTLLLASFASYGVGQVIERNGQLARARLQLVDLAVAAERERLARDVHDILGHSLTVITVKAELAGRLLEAAGSGVALDRARAEVRDLEQLARGALADVRSTVAGTREMSLAGELAAAREALAAAGIAADLPLAVDSVPAEARELFAWTLREGVTNVVRHSGARSCRITIADGSIEIRDDGRGPSAPPGGGTGLAGLRARAESAGGRLEVERSVEGGFLLRVRSAPARVAAG